MSNLNTSGLFAYYYYYRILITQLFIFHIKMYHCEPDDLLIYLLTA